jgi:hypothetical protein
MMNTSILSAREECGHLGEAAPGPDLSILVLVRQPGEDNQEVRKPLLFDEFGLGKVSFPAHLSVK